MTFIVRGHTLRSEGRGLRRVATDPSQWGIYAWKNGHGVCSCGTFSPELPSVCARKRWHREHKADVLRQQEQGS